MQFKTKRDLHEHLDRRCGYRVMPLKNPSGTFCRTKGQSKIQKKIRTVAKFFHPS